jgi:hypothetical protein
MATLVKMTDTKEPQLMTVVMSDSDVYDVLYAAININVVRLTDGSYEWDSLVLPDFALDNIYRADLNTKKAVLIAHIVKAYYDDNKMIAILNNYLADPNEEHQKEFEDLQKIRKLAKETVSEIIRNRLF